MKTKEGRSVKLFIKEMLCAPTFLFFEYMKRILSYLYCVLLVVSCNIDKNSKDQYVELKITDSVISLNIPPSLSPTVRNVQYLSLDGMDYLVMRNMSLNGKLFVFNMDNMKLETIIDPQKEGPNGLGGQVDGSFIVNFDTIIVTIKGYHDVIHVIDRNANLIKSINFDISYNPYLPISWINQNNTYYNNGYLVLPNWSASSEGWQEIEKYSLGYSYDFKTGSQENYPVNYPRLVLDGSDNPNNASMFIINDNKTIVSFDHNHYLYVFNDSIWTPVYAKSQYIDRPLQTQYVNNIDFTDQIKRFIELPKYLSIVYDEYRKVYYRFVYPGEDVNDRDDIMKQHEFYKTFSIMILDEDFNVIGETLMPEYTFNTFAFFINREGLWISTSHPDNPKFEEDVINFRLLELGNI